MSLESLTAFLDAYGYWFFFGVGFAEFAGAPLASSVVLIAAGGLVAGQGLSLPQVVGSAALGGFLADGIWFWLGRWKGHRVLDLACGLTSNPKACVVSVCHELDLLKKPYVVVAKLLPGTAQLLAPAAGLSGVSARVFLSRDALALIVWAATYTSVGWIFADQVEIAMSWVVGYFQHALWLVPGLIAAAVVWRVARVRVHRSQHGSGPGEEDRDVGTAESAVSLDAAAGEAG